MIFCTTVSMFSFGYTVPIIFISCRSRGFLGICRFWSFCRFPKLIIWNFRFPISIFFIVYGYNPQVKTNRPNLLLGNRISILEQRSNVNRTMLHGTGHVIRSARIFATLNESVETFWYLAKTCASRKREFWSVTNGTYFAFGLKFCHSAFLDLGPRKSSPRFPDCIQCNNC